jgi:hypothetical protein
LLNGVPLKGSAPRPPPDSRGFGEHRYGSASTPRHATLNPESPDGGQFVSPVHRWQSEDGALGYLHGADWMLLRVKLILRPSRLAPLSATTPVGWLPGPVAQIRLS